MKRERAAKRALIVGIVVASVVTISGLVSALHFQTPRFLLVTEQTGGTVDKISAWRPEFWGFNSSGDVLGNGNAVPQIFFYDHALRVLGGEFGVTQVTCAGSGASNPSMSNFDNLL